MSTTPDHERIREIINRLDEIQRESEFLRSKIARIRHARVEFPDRRDLSRMFDRNGSDPGGHDSTGDPG
jgi:hypothetical protein